MVEGEDVTIPVNKSIIIGAWLLFMQIAVSMERQKTIEKELNTSVEAKALGVSSNAFASPDYSFYSLALYSANAAADCVKASVTSTRNTFITTVSQSERFGKLGWPSTDPVAQAGLLDTLATYDAVKAIKNNKTFGPDNRVLLEKFARRINFVQEFVNSFLLFPDHEEGIARARYSLNKHAPALSSYYQELIVSYLEMRKDSTLRLSVELTDELKKLQKEIVTTTDERIEEVEDSKK